MSIAAKRQSDSKPAIGKQPKAVRLPNKSIWVDIDLKPNDAEHYGSLSDPLKAISGFAKDFGLGDLLVPPKRVRER
jgi:hypothetical protein